MSDLEKTHTSLKLSKWLHENGCRLETEYIWFEHKYGWKIANKERAFRATRKSITEFPAYDIFNELCCEYAEEVFGGNDPHQLWTHQRILFEKIIDNKKDEAEAYFMKTTIFNPLNQK